MRMFKRADSKNETEVTEGTLVKKQEWLEYGI